jgi:predicted ATPase
MLERIRLINFKAFRDQSLDLAPLTLLTGLNGSGKSSLLQALLLLRQSWELGYLARHKIALNGKYVSLGTFQDLLFEGATDDGTVGIRLGWRYEEQKGEEIFTIPTTATEMRLCALTGERSSPNEGLWGPQFRFLRAERIGPRVNYEIAEAGLMETGLGVSGEFAVEFLAHEGERLLSIPSCRHPLATSDLLRANVEAWMGEFSPNLRLVASSEADQDRVRLRYQFEGSRGLSNTYRPTNVGFGVSYTLPIILAILAAGPGDLLLLEAPEAHLHPRGQVKIGGLMALAAEAGVQIIVETHSDHVLNGVRVAVHQRLIQPTNAAFFYFQWDSKRADGATSVQRLTVDSKGRMENWPPGFFDETDRSLEVLLGPQPEE